MTAAARVAGGQVDGAQRCMHPRCDLPLNKKGKCPRGHTQEPVVAQLQRLDSMLDAVHGDLRSQVKSHREIHPERAQYLLQKIRGVLKQFPTAPWDDADKLTPVEDLVLRLQQAQAYLETPGDYEGDDLPNLVEDIAVARKRGQEVKNAAQVQPATGAEDPQADYALRLSAALLCALEDAQGTRDPRVGAALQLVGVGDDISMAGRVLAEAAVETLVGVFDDMQALGQGCEDDPRVQAARKLLTQPPHPAGFPLQPAQVESAIGHVLRTAGVGWGASTQGYFEDGSAWLRIDSEKRQEVETLGCPVRIPAAAPGQKMVDLLLSPRQAAAWALRLQRRRERAWQGLQQYQSYQGEDTRDTDVDFALGALESASTYLESYPALPPTAGVVRGDLDEARRIASAAAAALSRVPGERIPVVAAKLGLSAEQAAWLQEGGGWRWQGLWAEQLDGRAERFVGRPADVAELVGRSQSMAAGAAEVRRLLHTPGGELTAEDLPAFAVASAAFRANYFGYTHSERRNWLAGEGPGVKLRRRSDYFEVAAMWEGIGKDKKSYPDSALRVAAAATGLEPVLLHNAGRAGLVHWLTEGSRHELISGIRSSTDRVWAPGRDGTGRLWQRGERVSVQAPGGVRAGQIVSCSLRGEYSEETWPGHLPERGDRMAAVQPLAQVRLSNGLLTEVALSEVEYLG